MDTNATDVELLNAIDNAERFLKRARDALERKNESTTRQMMTYAHESINFVRRELRERVK